MISQLLELAPDYQTAKSVFAFFETIHNMDLKKIISNANYQKIEKNKHRFEQIKTEQLK